MWSGMFPELLNMIARKYIDFYEDYLTFARVCKSWHSAAATTVHDDYSNGPPSRFPSLLLAKKEKDGREFRELFFLSNKSIRKIRLPEAYHKMYRSSCGWLITVGSDNATQLINPLSRETINLPEVVTFSKLVEKLLIVTNNPSSLKLPLVVVLRGGYEMGFCRAGDNKWTSVGDYHMGIYDITYYNGQVYCFDKYKFIRACDVYGENPTALVDVSRLPTDLYDKTQSMGRGFIIGMYESKKKLLVVITHDLLDGKLSFHTKTEMFLLFAYDLEDERWSRVNNLGKKTLFVGHSSTFWVEDTIGVIKSNCIYFTNDVYFLHSESGGGRNMGIYHLSNSTIEPHFIGESSSYLTPIWLQSV